MFLSQPDILEHIKEGKLIFDPHVPEDRIEQVSVDLLLGRRFTVLRGDLGYIDSIRMDPEIWNSDLWEHTEQTIFELEPQRFVLAQTLERITLPNSLMGLVEGRSSYARLGVAIHMTAPKIDPGFDGHITLEMMNFGAKAVKLRAGIDKPAQLLLCATEIARDRIIGHESCIAEIERERDKIREQVRAASRRPGDG